jgi:ApbE superfamily uncharacterized protein (UPF0280 family)
MTVLARHENGAIAAVLPDGQRRHFQHGPIDLVLRADGAPQACEAAYAAAWRRFPHILPELAAELLLLRSPLISGAAQPESRVAQAMAAACRPHLPAFVTPMAAVAGAVADEVVSSMAGAAALDRAFVNNGGDIALWLADGQSLAAGIVMDQDDPALDGFAEIGASSPVRGIATSGWKGRSHSLGVADSVTVLAPTAAAADVAATLIANAVDVDDPAIERVQAHELDADSDLGDRLVTTAVGALTAGKTASALDNGKACAESMLAAGLILGALLSLQGETRVVGGAAKAPRLAAA